MVVQKDVRFGNTTHPVVFNSNALFKLEKETGLIMDRIGILMMTGQAGFRIMQYVLWCGLEAGRIRAKTRHQPFTLEEVGDLMDLEGGPAFCWAGEDDGILETKEEVDGQIITKKTKVREPRPAHHIALAVQEAWLSAFPKAREEPEMAENPPAAAE